MSQELIDAITDMREEDALKITNDLLDAGTDPLSILDDCKQAMDIIGIVLKREKPSFLN